MKFEITLENGIPAEVKQDGKTILENWGNPKGLMSMDAVLLLLVWKTGYGSRSVTEEEKGKWEEKFKAAVDQLLRIFGEEPGRSV